MLISRSPRFRLALDGYGLDDGSRFRGIGTYVRQLVEAVSHEDEIELVVLASRSAELPRGVERLDIPARLPARWQIAERERRLPAAIARSKADLFHSTGQVLPRKCSATWVHTLHDLTPLYFSHPLLAGEREYWLRVGPRLRHAAAVITPTRSSADQAARYLDVDPSRIHVVPYGVDLSYFVPDGPAAAYGDGYLLWLSAFGPHKGLDEALAVTASLADAGYPHKLVIAGHVDAVAMQRIQEAVARAGCEDRAICLGRVDDVRPLYRGASAVLSTSRAEGFGLTVLEAMACGAPVVCFDNTSLPEVVGDAGLMVPDGDVTAFAAAVRVILDDSSAAAQLRQAGIAHAQVFTWQRSAAGHVEVYRTVGAEPDGSR